MPAMSLRHHACAQTQAFGEPNCAAVRSSVETVWPPDSRGVSTEKYAIRNKINTRYHFSVFSAFRRRTPCYLLLQLLIVVQQRAQVDDSPKYPASRVPINSDRCTMNIFYRFDHLLVRHYIDLIFIVSTSYRFSYYFFGFLFLFFL